MPLSQHPTRLPKYLIYIVALMLTIAAAWYFTRPAPPSVQLVKVERGLVEATVSNTRAGSVKACRRAKMSAPAGGQIAHLLVHKGDRVKANQVLLELWNRDLEAQSRLSKEQLTTAQNQADQACLQASLADREAVRAQQLHAKGFISNEGLDQKSAAAKVARAGCDAAHSLIDQGRSRIQAADATLERMVLKAPFDGIVADISGELGEYATPSPPGIPTPPAIDLIDDSCMYVSAPIDEVDAANIKAGQQVRITLDAIRGKTFPGRVKRVSPYVLELEKQARTVEVEVDFINRQPQDGLTKPAVSGGAAQRLLPQSAVGSAISNVSQPSPTTENLLVGYSADVEIVHSEHNNVLRIPTQSILEGKHVLLYRPDGTLEDRTVTTGLANWEQTEITAGLNEGDRIVLSLDQPGIKAGTKVQPETAKAVK